MNIAICSDHAGFELKTEVKKFIKSIPFLESEYKIFDLGTHSEESVDYPDYANKLVSWLESNVGVGIAICGTGNGMAMSLNRVHGIRAGIAWNEEIAKLIKRHNNANVLVLPARFINTETAFECVEEWLKQSFEGGRHQRRIDKML